MLMSPPVLEMSFAVKAILSPVTISFLSGLSDLLLHDNVNNDNSSTAHERDEQGFITVGSRSLGHSSLRHLRNDEISNLPFQVPGTH